MILSAPKLGAPPWIMGIVNVTPDSFSDGGQHAGADAAVAHGLQLLAEGADVLDVGGESTRPGAQPVDAAEEVRRAIPVVEALAAAGATVSIDTMKPSVARAAIAAGATIWNDVTALQFAPESLETAAALGCGVVLMHMQGAPQTMQASPRYRDVVGETIGFLGARAAAARDAGIAPSALWVDPGIGFGKTLEHNLKLIAALPRLRAETGLAVAFGASRKSFIEKIDPGAGPHERIGGSIAAALAVAAAGAEMLRVHDVRATAQALKVQRALAGVGPD